MTDREFFIKTAGDETPRFERVFKSLPEDKLDYRPHPKSKSAGELAASMAMEATGYKRFLTTGVIDFMEEMKAAKPANFEESAKMFAQGLGEAKNIVEKMTDADWNSEAKMVEGNKVHWTTTKGDMALGELLDLIHHRGQLSTYIRPMGGKVPSIYGPSADSAG